MTTRTDSIPVLTATGVITRPIVPNFTLARNHFIKLQSPLKDSSTADVYVARAPSRYVGPAASSDKLLNIQLEARPESGGLVMSDDGLQFTTWLSVVLLDLNDPGSSTPLAGANTLRFWARQTHFDPQRLEIALTNNFERVEVNSSEPPDTVHLEVTMTIPLDTLHLLLPVLRPVIAVQAPRSIPGLGMGTATLNVGLPADAGSRLRKLRLIANQGTLDHQTFELGASDAHEVGLRSRGLGVDTIRVVTSQLAAAIVPVRYVVPIGLIVSAVLGTPLGALARSLRRRGSKARGTGAAWLASVIAGLSVVALYTIGVNVLPLELPFLQNEVAVFAVGVIGGFGGVAILEHLMGKDV